MGERLCAARVDQSGWGQSGLGAIAHEVQERRAPRPADRSGRAFRRTVERRGTVRPAQSAESKKRGRVSGPGGGPQMTPGHRLVPARARAVSVEQTQRPVRRYVSPLRHGREVGARRTMALRRGTPQPFDRLGRIAKHAFAVAVHHAQQILGRRMTLNRHPQQDAVAFQAAAGPGKLMGHVRIPLRLRAWHRRAGFVPRQPGRIGSAGGKSQKEHARDRSHHPAILTACGRRAAHAVALAAACCTLATTADAGERNPTVPALIEVPAGPFIAGSDAAEREAAYRLDETAYGHSRTREGRWYARERKRGTHRLEGFFITRTPITNRQYAAFVAATGRPAPGVDEATWRGYGLIHPYTRTRRHSWQDGMPPEDRGDHPVVLVSHADANAYAAWLSARTGRTWRLPTELEWEKAARGTDGRLFPWGDGFDPARLNSHDAGPFDTMPVGRFPAGASPYGMLDAAGQVFEWTATRGRPGRFTVKGGSWDDSGCGVCRPAARHGRPAALKHILIGFRLAADPAPESRAPSVEQ